MEDSEAKESKSNGFRTLRMGLEIHRLLATSSFRCAAAFCGASRNLSVRDFVTEVLFEKLPSVLTQVIGLFTVSATKKSQKHQGTSTPSMETITNTRSFRWERREGR